jgi:hypothetical protein
MIKSIGIGRLAEKKIKILEELKMRKQDNPSYKIIDVGGAKEKHCLDKFSFIDAYVDMRVINDHRVKGFNGNINDPNLWEEIVNYVKINGKFDYCLCTHTLEDISSLLYVVSQICKISISGFLSFPSKYRELSRFEPNLYRGYYHHRWIFISKKDYLLALPKINIIEHIFFDTIAAKCNVDNYELYAEWNDNINLKIINNDWLGPNYEDCLDMYKKELLESNEDYL